MKAYLLFSISFFLSTSLFSQQDYLGDSDLVDSIAQQWNEIGNSRTRTIRFDKNGTFRISFVYDNAFKISGRYWLYETPENASLAYQEFAEREEIKSAIQAENPFKPWQDKGVHVDTKKYHGFIMEQRFYNQGGTEFIPVWVGGVWRIYRNKLEMKQGSSREGGTDIFTFKGEKISVEGW